MKQFGGHLQWCCILDLSLVTFVCITLDHDCMTKIRSTYFCCLCFGCKLLSQLTALTELLFWKLGIQGQSQDWIWMTSTQTQRYDNSFEDMCIWKLWSKNHQKLYDLGRVHVILKQRPFHIWQFYSCLMEFLAWEYVTSRTLFLSISLISGGKIGGQIIN